jgi:hypothetical protein
VRRGKTYALLNYHVSKKRKLENPGYMDQKGAYEARIRELESKLDQMTQAAIT